MKRVVIIEGCDNIGKSTLATILHQTLKHPTTVRHFGAPVSKGVKAFTEQMKTLDREMCGIDDGSDVEIWDRSVIGENVYGPMYRRGQYSHTEYHVESSYVLKNREKQIFLIVLYTDGEMFKRLKITSKKDETLIYQRQEEAEDISTKFVDVATNLRLKHTLFVNCANYESLNDRNNYIRRRVWAWLEYKRYRYEMAENYSQTFFNAKSMVWARGEGFSARRYACREFDNGKCVIGKDHRQHCEFGEVYDRPTFACGGTHNVDYVFVGEAPGHKGCGKLGIPFFGDMSGNLLQETLDSCGILPTRYYMTNTVKCCPKDNKLHLYGDHSKLTCIKQLSAEMRMIKRKNPEAMIVAIGKTAAKELSQLGIEHRMVYHPAYYLRKGAGDDFITDFRKVVTACQ